MIDVLSCRDDMEVVEAAHSRTTKRSGGANACNAEKNKAEGRRFIDGLYPKDESLAEIVVAASPLDST